VTATEASGFDGRPAPVLSGQQAVDRVCRLLPS
jgi:hypothetical protein